MPTEPLLSRKELASELRRSVSYVAAMKARGFRMIGGRATLADALRFLETCPHPKAGDIGGHRGTLPAATQPADQTTVLP